MKNSVPNIALCLTLATAITVASIPVMAFAQEQVMGQNYAAQDAISNSLHDKVLSGETVFPHAFWTSPLPTNTVTNDWKQSAFAKNGKVVVEIAASTCGNAAYWTLEDLESLKPDILIAYDYNNNVKWELEAKWIVSKYNTFMFEEGTLRYVKVDCITPGALNTSCGRGQLQLTNDSGDRVTQYFEKADIAWFNEDDTDFVDGADATLVIGKNVTSLDDYWAVSFARNYKKIVFEEGSQLAHVGNACGYGDSYIKEIEGLPSTAKLDKNALGTNRLEKVTDENGKGIKAPESVWTWQYGEHSKEYGALSPAAPNYWKQQLKKVKNISLSVKAKKGGKSAFAKINNVAYKKSKATVLKGSKYKKASKTQAKKIVVSKVGKVTVKKGLKKGTYKVNVKAACKGHSKTVTATVKVK